MSAAGPLLIIGASYAGTRIAQTARELGYDGPIVLAGDEIHAPYQRPPLSKGVLGGRVLPEQLPLWGDDFFRRNAIDWRPGHRAVRIDPGAHEVEFDDGSTMTYRTLALTSGARCRSLAIPGAELEGVYGLRNLDDATRLRSALSEASRLCVIGGGFIGLEVAASARQLGLDVTVIEALPRLLARALTPALSGFVSREHQSRGVAILTGAQVRALQGIAGRVRAVELADGRRLACDLVVVGVGAQPNEEPALRAGISTGNGILTDGLGRTSAPDVLAAGDVARMAFDPGHGEPALALRLESVHAANEGARAAASGLVGRARPFGGVPWFWSDQFDLKLQIAGLAQETDMAVLRGDPDAGRFSVFHLRQGRVAAVQSVNRPGEHMLARKWIESGVRIDSATLADRGVDLQQITQGASRP